MAAKTVYQIFRYEKVKSAGAIRWREIEQNRTQTDKNIDFVGDIDFERTQNNVYLVHGKDFLKRIEEELKNHGIEKHRKDAILMLDGVVTMSPEKAKEMSKEEIEQYFRDALAFVEKNQGVVINAVIHYDETTPHLHYDVIPLIQKADNTWKLSAKDVVGNSSKMTKMQTLFNDEVGKNYGLERGERKAPNKENRKHKTKLQHDIEMQQATIAEQKEIIKEHNDNIKDCEMLEQAYAATIQNQETTMQDNDVTIQNQITELDKKDKAIEDKKAEYNQINEQAKEAYFLNEKFKKENAELEQKYNEMHATLNRRDAILADEKGSDYKTSKFHPGYVLVKEERLQKRADAYAVSGEAKQLMAKAERTMSEALEMKAQYVSNQYINNRQKTFDEEIKESYNKAYEQAIADVSKALDKPITAIKSAIDLFNQVEQEADYGR